MRERFFLILAIILAVAGVYYFVLAKRQSAPDITSQKVTSNDKPQSPPQDCGEATAAQAAGPYYKEDSPERQNIAEDSSGEPLIVTGYVFDKECNPVPDAWIDFWQAGANGQYDLEGFLLRGHQFTNEEGLYRLETVIPSEYGTRPPHIHVKLQGEGPVFTTQIYFPGENLNVLEVDKRDGVSYGSFNFVLPY
ncbi:hypothetical protein IID21_03635 [Patescibacteria group bacterium]|nr:hypothetical protein [Patescibacteria group bacterium]